MRPSITGVVDSAWTAIREDADQLFFLLAHRRRRRGRQHAPPFRAGRPRPRPQGRPGGGLCARICAWCCAPSCMCLVLCPFMHRHVRDTGHRWLCHRAEVGLQVLSDCIRQPCRWLQQPYIALSPLSLPRSYRRAVHSQTAALNDIKEQQIMCIMIPSGLCPIFWSWRRSLGSTRCLR